MKTALTELIEKWERMNLIAKHTADAALVMGVINSAKQLLEKEKQQIMNGYEQGYECTAPLKDSVGDDCYDKSVVFVLKTN